MRSQEPCRPPGPGRRAASGGLESFEEQIRPHLQAVRAAARRILGDDDAAADAVQEALITLWQTDVLPEHLRRWLLRTVVHRSLHARRTQLRRSYWEDQGGGAMLACTLCNPERETEVRELIDCLDRALDALSPEHQEILLLRELEGFEYQEIADLLGLPVGTVRSRLNRARARARASADAGE